MEKKMKKELLKVVTAKISISMDKKDTEPEKQEAMKLKAKEVALEVATEWLVKSCPDRFACELAEMAGLLHEVSPESYEDFLILIGADDPKNKEEQKDIHLSKEARFNIEALNVGVITFHKKDLEVLQSAMKDMGDAIEEGNGDELVLILRAMAEQAMSYLITNCGYTLEGLTAHMTDIYRRKNKDYGNSFDKSLDEDGLLVAKIRIGDKINRMLSLLKKGEAEVKDESLNDTLIDLANYSIMTVLWIQDQDVKKGKKEE